MPLTTGTKVGPYDIQQPLGEGGMSACGPRVAPQARSASGWGCPPPLAGCFRCGQLRRGLAVARTRDSGAKGEGPTRIEKS
jgi:hypothetical protein